VEEGGHEGEVVVYWGGARTGEVEGDFCVGEVEGWVCEDVFEVYGAVPFGLLCGRRNVRWGCVFLKGRGGLL
jgi:hypothetical protein